MMGPEQRALLLRNVGALRDLGWSAARSVAFIAERSGEPELQRVAQDLASGTEPNDVATDPLVAILARGEASGGDILREVARGYELQANSMSALRRSFLISAVSIIVVSAVLFGFSWLVDPSDAILDIWSGVTLPAMTTSALAALAFVRRVGSFVLVAAVLALAICFRMRVIPGHAGLQTASHLRMFAAAVRSGIDEHDALRFVGTERTDDFLRSRTLRLNRYERILGAQIKEREGAVNAALLLAQEKESESGRIWELFLHVGPALVLMGVAVFVGLVVVGFYLPFFSIARVF